MDWGQIFSHPVTQQAILWAVPYVMPVILTGVVWMLKKGIDLLGVKVKESQTKIDDYLLGVAVKYAEDKFGPDTGNGQAKMDAACAYIELISKGRLKAAVMRPMLMAKYQELFGSLSGLKNA